MEDYNDVLVERRTWFIALLFATLSAGGQTTALKARVAAVQSAASSGQHDVFQSELSRLKSAVASAPAGGERDAARSVIAVYDDLAAVWNYQIESQTGSFFDSSSEIFQAVNRYAGYRSFISDSTVSSGGNRFYPTSETRTFLIREAARRAAGVKQVTAEESKPARKSELPRAVVRPAASDRPSTPVVEPKAVALPASAASVPATPAPPVPSVTSTSQVAPATAAAVTAPTDSALTGSATLSPPAIATSIETNALDEPAVSVAELPREPAPAPATNPSSERSRGIGIGPSVVLIIAGLAIVLGVSRAAR